MDHACNCARAEAATVAPLAPLPCDKGGIDTLGKKPNSK